MVKEKRYCAAFGCTNTKFKNKDLTFHKLPKNPERCREWIQLIGREDLLNRENIKSSSYEICNLHFDDSAFECKRHLKTDAVPTKCHKKSSSESVQILKLDVKNTKHVSTQTQADNNQQTLPDQKSKAVQTTKNLSEQTSRKRKLWQNVIESNRKRKRLTSEFNKIKKELEAKNHPITTDIEDDISIRFRKLIDWQNKLTDKNKGNRYDAEYKVFALNLHCCSPQTYRNLQTVLKLPSKRTLQRYKLKIPPKLDDRVLDSLSMKIKSLPEKANYCTICVDEIVLKRNLYYDIKTDEIIGFHNIAGKMSPEIASNAYVILLQGIYCEWEQPIAYALLASTKHYGELDEWMNEVINKLFGIGIEVKAIISDQGSNFYIYAKDIKKVTINNPFFFVDGRKIYYIFDVPHLVKCVRNNLLSSNFYINGKVVSWDYIKNLYEDQKHKNLRLIPKLTDAHIAPNNFQKKKVKYAAQIFSHTVYAALETYIDFGVIPDEGRATASFVKLMNDVFDVLNSSKFNTPNKSQNAFIMSIQQMNILRKAENMFATIKSINHKTGLNNTNLIKTFYNFQISLQSIQQLFLDLKKEGFGHLFTRRLNQDPLENFFSSVRQQGGSCTVPTPIQFSRAFSKLFLVNMLKNPPYTNCEVDIYDILLNAEDIVKKQNIAPDKEVQIVSPVLLNDESDYRIDLPDINALTYVAGYLFYKCLKKHNCEEIQNKSNSVSQSLDSGNVFSHYKAYNKQAKFFGNLKMPSAEFKEYIETLETTFTHTFRDCIPNQVGSKILHILEKIPAVKLCPCFPSEYLLKLFIRLRVFSTVRFNNRCFRTEEKSIKQYLKLQPL